jgi:hypothetical protein
VDFLPATVDHLPQTSSGSRILFQCQRITTSHTSQEAVFEVLSTHGGQRHLRLWRLFDEPIAARMRSKMKRDTPNQPREPRSKTRIIPLVSIVPIRSPDYSSSSRDRPSMCSDAGMPKAVEGQEGLAGRATNASTRNANQSIAPVRIDGIEHAQIGRPVGGTAASIVVFVLPGGLFANLLGNFGRWTAGRFHPQLNVGRLDQRLH